MVIYYQYNIPGMRLAPVLFIFYCCMLNACKTAYKADPGKSTAVRAVITPPDTLIQKQHRGIDFFAQGNTPVQWTLEVDLEKGFSFKPADGRTLFASPVQATKLTTAGTDVYETKTDAGAMKVIVYNEPCDGNEKDKKTTRKTEVTINKKRYLGCGNYLYDYKINDIWTLETIGNKNPEGPVKNLPWLEFNLEKNKMNGYDGCNHIGSDIKVEGNRIKFSVFTGTKIACPTNETAQLFTTMLSDHVVDYYIKDGRLVLILINETKLIFIKKE